MATENVPVFNKYDGNGAATEFSIGFPYLDTSFIKVYIKRNGENEEKLDDSRFSFVNDTTIKFPVLETDTVLQEGEVITIQRETSLGSDYEFDNQIRLFPEEVMNADDLSFQQIQELARDLERAVKVRPTDNQTSDELIDEVYGSLSSAIDIAGDAINAANQAQQAADNAIASVEEAQKQVIAVTEYTDQKKAEIDNIVKEAEESVDSTIASAVEEVRQSALDAAYEAINDAAAEATAIVVEYTNKEIKPQLNEIANNASESAENASESAGLAAEEAEEAKHWAEDSRVWATGEDAEVEELESGEHSARIYSELAKAGAIRAEEAEGRIGDVAHLSNDETFTGQKTFEQKVTSKGNFYRQIDFPYTDTPAETSYVGYTIKDSNNNTFAGVDGVLYSSGTNCTQMYITGKSGTLRRMYVQETKDGTVTYNYGQTAGSQWIKIPKGAGTAVLICWGNVGVADIASSKTVSFPTAFTDNPRIALTSSGGSSQVYQNVINSMSTTNFKMICTGGAASQGFHWIAVGNAAL